MPARMPADVETALIARAQAGDDAATLELLSAYAPAINAGARAFARVIPSREDAVGAATIGVLTAIKAFDPTRCARLAGMVRNYIQDQLWEVATKSIGSMTVPRTILARYFRLMSDERVAGNIAAAREVAPEYSISGATAFAVWSALNSRNLDIEPADDRDEIACVEDRILTGIALDAMDPLDRSVCELRYGFTDHREMPIEDVAVQLALTPTRAKQALARGLASARKALA